jgi:hypothetical protein
MNAITKLESSPTVYTHETEVQECGASFAISEVQGDEAVKTMATILEKTTLPVWEHYRGLFIKAYAMEREVNINACDKAWERFAGRMLATYGLEKPKSIVIESKAKADKREETKKQVNEILAKGKDAKGIDKIINDCISKGDTVKASLALKAKETLIKAVAKKQGVTMKARVKAVDNAVKLVKKDVKRFFALEKHLGLVK